MRRAFKRLLTDHVYHAPWIDDDAAGGPPVFGNPVRRRARIEHGHRVLRTTPGEERVSTMRIFLDGPVAIEAHDRIIVTDDIPDDDTIRRAAPIVHVQIEREPNGAVHHAEVYL